MKEGREIEFQRFIFPTTEDLGIAESITSIFLKSGRAIGLRSERVPFICLAA